MKKLIIHDRLKPHLKHKHSPPQWDISVCVRGSDFMPVCQITSVTRSERQPEIKRSSSPACSHNISSLSSTHIYWATSFPNTFYAPMQKDYLGFQRKQKHMVFWFHHMFLKKKKKTKEIILAEESLKISKLNVYKCRWS